MSRAQHQSIREYADLPMVSDAIDRTWQPAAQTHSAVRPNGNGGTTGP